MGETLPLFTPLFNKSVQIESRPEHLTGESGALIQREIMERSGIIDWLAARLHNPRKPELITYPLSDLLRTHLLLLGQGWRDQDDADRLRQDPGLRVANSTRRGVLRPLRSLSVPGGPELIADGADGPLHAAFFVAAGHRHRARLEAVMGREREQRGMEEDGLPPPGA